MKIKNEEIYLGKKYSEKEYKDFYSCPRDAKEKEVFYKKILAQKLVRYTRDINELNCDNIPVCPKEQAKNIELLFTDFFNYVFFAGEIDFDDMIPTEEELYDSTNTYQDKFKFMYKYYMDREDFDTFDEFIDFVKDDIADSYKFFLEICPDLEYRPLVSVKENGENNTQEYTKEQIEKINKAYKSIYEDSTEKTSLPNEDISLEDKIHEIWTFYECAGFDIKTDDDFCRLLGL